MHQRHFINPQIPAYSSQRNIILPPFTGPTPDRPTPSRQLQYPNPSAPMRHLNAGLIDIVPDHILQRLCNRITNRLFFSGRIAIRSCASRLELPRDVVYISGVDLARVLVRHPFDVGCEVVGGGGDAVDDCDAVVDDRAPFADAAEAFSFRRGVSVERCGCRGGVVGSGFDGAGVRERSEKEERRYLGGVELHGEDLK